MPQIDIYNNVANRLHIKCHNWHNPSIYPTIRQKNGMLLNHVDMPTTHASISVLHFAEWENAGPASWLTIVDMSTWLRHMSTCPHTTRQQMTKHSFTPITVNLTRHNAGFDTSSTTPPSTTHNPRQHVGNDADILSTIDALPSTCRHMPSQQTLRALLLPSLSRRSQRP
jgi:hypothetical protein